MLSQRVSSISGGAQRLSHAHDLACRGPPGTSTGLLSASTGKSKRMSEKSRDEEEEGHGTKAPEPQTCRSPLPRAAAAVARSKAELPRRRRAKASTMLRSPAQTAAPGDLQEDMGTPVPSATPRMRKEPQLRGFPGPRDRNPWAPRHRVGAATTPGEAAGPTCCFCCCFWQERMDPWDPWASVKERCRHRGAVSRTVPSVESILG